MYGHSTPLECSALKQQFSIDILPLRGRRLKRLFGESVQGQLLIISHTDLGQRIRIISARKVTRQERKIYEND
ncbi:hypothetical protein C6499_22155 [Candidatus Poribacteria bacterium]|nr:MAG: hypothetical protein C6499_22155 [Candidatus Poribacteria bacterium]